MAGVSFLFNRPQLVRVFYWKNGHLEEVRLPKPPDWPEQWGWIHEMHQLRIGEKTFEFDIGTYLVVEAWANVPKEERFRVLEMVGIEEVVRVDIPVVTVAIFRVKALNYALTVEIAGEKRRAVGSPHGWIADPAV